VVVVVMSDENRPDIADVEARLGDSPRRAVAGVDDIECAVDDQEI
jgi:hypothetical protein